MRRAALLGLVTVSVAACAGFGDSVVYPPNLTKYRSGIAEWAGSNGELLAEIRGAPFGTGVTPEAVAKAVPVPDWVARRMTVTPSPATPRDYRVVLNFGPAFPGDSGDAVCAGAAPQPAHVAAPGQRMPVAATYCIFNEAMTSVRGVGPVAASPDDRGFQQFMYVMLAQLIPIRDPSVGGFCNDPSC